MRRMFTEKQIKALASASVDNIVASNTGGDAEDLAEWIGYVEGSFGTRLYKHTYYNDSSSITFISYLKSALESANDIFNKFYTSDIWQILLYDETSLDESVSCAYLSNSGTILSGGNDSQGIENVDFSELTTFSVTPL